MSAPKPRRTTVLLYDGDDFERIAELRREVEIARRKLDEAEYLKAASSGAPRRAGDKASGAEGLEAAEAEVDAAADALGAFVDEASERAEEWVLEPIGNQEYRGLLKAHPPRTSTVKTTADDGSERETEQIHTDDAPFGINTETFPRALLAFVDDDDDEIRTIAEPVFASEAERRKRLKRLSVGEFDTLWIRAKMLNEGMVADPKADLSLSGFRTSNAT